MGFAIESIRLQLRQTGDGVFRESAWAWLPESWRDPGAFAAALRHFQAAGEPSPPKSQPESGYDLYHDLVLRHATGESGAVAALQWLDGEELRRLTYAELHRLCTERRQAWLQAGVRPRQRLCIVAAPGPELLVPLCTGLRLGLEVSLLPPAGPEFLARRLGGLQPNHVALARRYLPLLRRAGMEGQALVEDFATPQQAAARDLAAATGLDATSHTYGADATALRLFSPLHEPPHEAVEVSAADAYHGALRDGLLLLDLQRGQVVAEAEQPLLQVQPALLLTTLVRGATLLHLRAGAFERDVRRDDPLARLPPVRVLFVSAALRDVMLQAPPRPPFAGLELWIANPQETPAPNAWSDWVERWKLHAAAGMALVYDTACGGSVLFSQRRFGGPAGYLMPAPGRPFELLAPNDSGEPAVGDAGQYQPRPRAVPLLLTRLDGGYLYAGTPTPTREGACYPSREVEQVVQGLPFVYGASVVEQPGDRNRPTLLVFAGPETQAYARHLLDRRVRIVRQTILQQLTPDYMPARVVVSSALPRLLADGTVDHRWCAQTFLSGELRRRSANPIFAFLDRLLLSLIPYLSQPKGGKP